MRIALVNVQLLDGNNVVAPLGVLYIAGQLERDGHTWRCSTAIPTPFRSPTRSSRGARGGRPSAFSPPPRRAPTTLLGS